PGSPVALPLPASATSLIVTRPDGSTAELLPGTIGGSSVSFSQTDQLGVYTATAVLPKATPTPAAPATASGGPSSAPGPAGSAGPGALATPVPSAPAVDPRAPMRFAVDLFNTAESNIAPGSPSLIEALGGGTASSANPSASPGSSGTAGPATSGSPAPSSGAGATASERPAARDELWVPIVLLVLVVLMAEWLVYQRDAVLRLWRGLRGRLARGGDA
ncbi:MAG: hypothetical protein HY264_05800, partial [Chloroflexi bacterium]|nr:hypothetical protein [Chloroflexota bacterium]